MLDAPNVKVLGYQPAAATCFSMMLATRTGVSSLV
jgi:hypothetical protein